MVSTDTKFWLGGGLNVEARALRGPYPHNARCQPGCQEEVARSDRCGQITVGEPRLTLKSGTSDPSGFSGSSRFFEFDNGTGSGAVYGTSTYGSPAEYGARSVQWSIPAGGIDSMNRIVSWLDAASNETSYSIDDDGRMLTRFLSTDSAASSFVWDGMNVVQETNPEGVVTLYNVLQGVLRSFSRSDVTYQVHTDALGSVRKVTDESGTVVATNDSDAWGTFCRLRRTAYRTAGWHTASSAGWGCGGTPTPGSII